MVKTRTTRTGEAPTGPNHLLDDAQLAEMLRIEPRTLRLWRRTRALPFIRLTPRVLRYRRADIDQWLAQHRVAIG